MSIRMSAVGAFAALLASPVAFAQQASLSLTNSGSSACRYNVTEWSFDVSGEASEADVVEWTVAATRGATGPDKLRITGFLTIANNGAAPASLGNIILNLQRRQGNTWVSAAADVADSSAGDASVFARCCPQASSEGRSFFAESAASSTLEFIDVNNNTIFSMFPQPQLAGGQTITLQYTAEFNSAELGVATGGALRVEAIVSFGNAGRRGNGASTCGALDISGDGAVTIDEQQVRSVVSRTGATMPVLQPVNDTMTIVAQSKRLSSGGNVSVDGFSTDFGDGSEFSTETVANSVVRHVYTPFSATEPGGYLEFCADMTGNSSSCVAGTSGSDCARVDINIDSGCPAVFCDGDYTTYSKGGYQGNGVPGQLLIQSFPTAFPNGLVIGKEPGFSATWTDVTKLRSFLNQGGPSGRLSADTLNATSTSGGNLAGQTAALTVNVALASGFGNLRLCGTAYQSTGVAGDTVATVLGKINTYMSGGALPAGMNASGLNNLADKLNTCFEAGVVSTWAIENLCP